MAIYLDNNQSEGKYLVHALEQDSSIPPWIKKSLISKINSDTARKQACTDCPEHKFGTYKGEKECCTVCGYIGIGMGESWELNAESIKTISKG